MSSWADLMSVVGFGIDDQEDVWMWSDDPASVRWEVTIVQRWSAIAGVERPRRVTGIWLEITETWIDGAEEGLYRPDIAYAYEVSPLSAWRVDRDDIAAIEIDFGDGTKLKVP